LHHDRAPTKSKEGEEMSIITACVGIFFLLISLFFAFGSGIDTERGKTPIVPIVATFTLAIMAVLFLLARL
jgi:hypothetical protein